MEAKNGGKLAPAWKPGVSPNPGGKPVGARNRLQGSFLNALAEDFDKHGVVAITKCREDDPVGYLKIVASLMPKELDLQHDMSAVVQRLTERIEDGRKRLAVVR